jgi:hypothetical protein
MHPKTVLRAALKCTEAVTTSIMEGHGACSAYFDLYSRRCGQENRLIKWLLRYIDAAEQQRAELARLRAVVDGIGPEMLRRAASSMAESAGRYGMADILYSFAAAVEEYRNATLHDGRT